MLAETVRLSLQGGERVLSTLEDVDRSLRSLTQRQFDIDASNSILAFSELADVASEAKEAITALSSELVSSYLAQDTAATNAATLADNIEELKKSVGGSTGDIKNAASEADLLTASYDLLSAGVSNTADVTGILGDATKAAKGGLSDVATVGDFTTNVLNSYGDSLGYMGDTQERANRIMSQGIAVQNLGKTTLGAYASSAGKAANVAATFNQDLDEFNALIARATKAGLPLETALSGIEGAYTSIAQPTKDAADEAERLGITLNTQALSEKGLVGLLKEIEERSPNAADSLSRIFGDISAFSLSSSIISDFEDFDNIQNQIINSSGLLESQFEKVSKSSQFFIDRFNNLKTDVFADLGEGVFAFFKPFLVLGTEALSLFNALPAPVKQVTGVVIGASVALGGTVAVVGTLSAVLPAATVAWGVFTAAMTGGVVSTNSATIATAANNAGLIAHKSLLLLTAGVTKGAALANGILGVSYGVLTKDITLAGVAQKAFALSSTLVAKSASLAATATGGLSSVLGVIKGGFLTAVIAAKGFLVTLAPIAGAAALVGVGIASLLSSFDTLQSRFSETEGEKVAREIAAIGNSAEETENKLSNAKGEGFLDTIKKDFKDGGVLNVVQAALVRTESFMRGNGAVVSDYGNTWLKTSQQVRNAQETIGLTKVFDQTNNVIEETKGLLNEYGTNVIDANDVSRLGASGINEYNQKSQEQVDKINETIAALESMKLEVGANKEAINSEIKTLTAFRDKLEGSSSELTTLGENAADVAKDLGTLEEQVSRLDKQLNDSLLSTEIEIGQKQSSGLENLQTGQGADTLTAVSDSQQLSENITDRQTYLKSLKDLLNKEGADREAINKKIIEGEKALNADLISQQQERIKLQEETSQALRNSSQLEAEIQVDNARSREDKIAAELNLIATKKKNAQEELTLQRQANAEALKAAQSAGASQEQIANIKAKNREAELSAIKTLTAIEKEEAERTAAIKLEAVARRVTASQELAKVANLEADIAKATARTREEENAATLAATATKLNGLKEQLKVEQDTARERLAIAKEQGLGEEELAELTRENRLKDLELSKQIAEAEKKLEQELLRIKLDNAKKVLEAKQQERALATSQVALNVGGDESAVQSLERQALAQNLADRQAYLEELQAIAEKEGKLNEDLKDKIVKEQTEINKETLQLQQERVTQQKELIEAQKSNALLQAEAAVSNARGVEQERAALENLAKLKRDIFEDDFRAIQEREAQTLKALETVGASELEVNLARQGYINERLELEKQVTEFEEAESERRKQIAQQEIEAKIALQSQLLENQISLISQSNNLTNANLSLGKSQLREQTLKNQLAIEELLTKKALTEDLAKQEQIEAKIIAIKRGEAIEALNFKETELQAQISIFETEQKVLALKNQQKALELELVLLKAKQNNASQDELALIQAQITAQKDLIAAQNEIAGVQRETLDQDLTNVGLEKDVLEASFKREDLEADREEIKPITQPTKDKSAGVSTNNPTYNINVTAPDPFAEAEKLINSAQRNERYLGNDNK